MKAVTAVASSGSSHMESSRAVADKARMDVEEEERDEFRSSKVQNIRRRIRTKASMEESHVDDAGESTEHQAKNRDENITGREQKRRESYGSNPVRRP